MYIIDDRKFVIFLIDNFGYMYMIIWLYLLILIKFISWADTILIIG